MERWDIYDVNKQLTGRTMARNDWNMAPGDYHLTVLGIVTDCKGNFLVTQRKLNKSWAPGAWEVPGGGVMAGESSEEAVRREVGEETGLDTSVGMAAVKLVDSYRSDSPAEKNNYFVDIYHIRLDFAEGDVHAQEKEMEGFRLVTYAQLQELAQTEEFLHFKRLEKAFAQIAEAK